MKIFAISGIDDTKATAPMATSTMYLAWGSIALVTVALFMATLKIRGEHGTS